MIHLAMVMSCSHGSWIRFMVDSLMVLAWEALSLNSHLLDDESLICCCRHMHKDHILEL